MNLDGIAVFTAEMLGSRKQITYRHTKGQINTIPMFSALWANTTPQIEPVRLTLQPKKRPTRPMKSTCHFKAWSSLFEMRPGKLYHVKHEAAEDSLLRSISANTQIDRCVYE